MRIATLACFLAVVLVSSSQAQFDVELTHQKNNSTESQGHAVQTEQDIETYLSGGLYGKDFWCAFPPASGTFGFGDQYSLEIYVLATADCQVTVSSEQGDYNQATIKAGEMHKFESKSDSKNWTVTESELVMGKGVHVEATAPVAVYVLTNRVSASDGYLAIPTYRLGTEYRHLGYNDYKAQWGNFRFGGGFIIVATEDNTTVSYTLSGTSDGGKTKGGAEIGEVETITLKRGETYMVQGDATDRNFDMSGTYIQSSSPIAVVSFHQQASLPIPSTWSWSLGHLCEMVPPIQRWGKRAVSVNFQGQYGTYYRIMAKEDNTEFSVKLYSASGDNKFIRFSEGILQAGEIASFAEADPRDDNGGPETSPFLNGLVVWEATKPILVMQYSFADGWTTGGTPVMTIIPPFDQRVLQTRFATPPNANTNDMIIIAVGDPESSSQKELESIRLNDVKLADVESRFTVNQIPQTELYWSNVSLEAGTTYNLRGRTPFTAIVYGAFGGTQRASYAFPVGMAGNRTDVNDLDPPSIEMTTDCAQVTVIATEQEELGTEKIGIASAQLLQDYSENAKLNFGSTGGEAPEGTETFVFSLQALDPTKDMSATFVVYDHAGNAVVDSAFVPALNENMRIVLGAAGQIEVGEQHAWDIPIQNNSEDEITVVATELMFGEHFSVPNLETPVILASEQSLNVQCTYTPHREMVVFEQYDTDTLIVSSACGSVWYYPVQGQGRAALIEATGAQFVETHVDSTTCIDNAIVVENTGSATLVIESIAGLEAPFGFAGNVNLPIGVESGQQLELPVCFAPTDTLEHEIEVVLTTNAEKSANKNVMLTGKGYKTIVGIFDSPAEALTVYPNPSHGVVNIVGAFGTYTGEVQLEVFDVAGRRLFEQGLVLSNGGGTFNLDKQGIVAKQVLVRITETESGRMAVANVNVATR